MLKNTASQKVGIQAVAAADGSAFTSTVTVSVTGDAGTQATGSVGSGVCTHEGNGYHTYAPAQAETNYDLVAFTFTGTGMIPSTVQIYTRGGDAFTRLGAPAGASVSADIAAMKVDTAAILVDTGTTLDARIPAALVSGRMDVSVGAMAANVLTATAINADAITDAKVASDVTIASVTGAVGSVTGAVGSVTGNVGGNVTGTVGSVVGAVGSVTGNVGGNVTGSVGSVVGAVGSVTGLTASNLDTTISSRMATYTQPTGFLAATFPATVASTTNITAGTITTATNLTNLPAITADWITATGLAASAVTEIQSGLATSTLLTTALTESYPTDGSTMTVAQALYLLTQRLGEFSISGTTITVKKVDGSTTAATYTLDDATTPTSSTRAS